MCLIFVGKGCQLKIFNNENFAIYGMARIDMNEILLHKNFWHKKLRYWSFIIFLSLSLSLSFSLSVCLSLSLSPCSSKIYKRQSTADSAVSTGDEDYSSYGFMCKKNIEEEEAAAEAKVRSMIPQDMPHPSLSGMPLPSSEHKVLIHIQRSKLDGNTREVRGRQRSRYISITQFFFFQSTDGSSHPPYLEGEHWIKGKLIGTGAFCSCFLARDIKNGTMFAVKQVSRKKIWLCAIPISIYVHMYMCHP